jgi:formylglycine-generating enzyme required for sulfatase activity
LIQANQEYPHDPCGQEGLAYHRGLTGQPRTDGRWFLWGNTWEPTLANTHDLGPFDTMPVGSFPTGQSPFDLLDPAGQAFEWTVDTAGQGRVVVKGAGSWDDKGCGVCRPAARHTRPAALKHILIGFRLVREVQ